MRIKIVKDYKQYKTGEIVEVTPNVAFGLIDRSVGVVTKDMVVDADYASKAVKPPVNRPRNKNGRSA
jgi:hypothetical protein